MVKAYNTIPGFIGDSLIKLTSTKNIHLSIFSPKSAEKMH